MTSMKIQLLGAKVRKKEISLDENQNMCMAQSKTTKAIDICRSIAHDNIDIFIKSTGTRAARMAEGLTCTFHGKEIQGFEVPCPKRVLAVNIWLTGYHLSITSTILITRIEKCHSCSLMVIRLICSYHFSITFMILIMHVPVLLEITLPLIFGK
jgi:hypothetical protein